MSEDNLATFEEALRLTIAFYCIMEPEKREIIKALVEKYADKCRLEEAAAVDPFREPEIKPPAVATQVELLQRQREYARHLATLRFSVVEDAIERLGR